MNKNQAGQVMGAQMVDATTGGPFAGTVTIFLTGDTGAQVLGSVGAGLCTPKGNGLFEYLPTQAETNFDLIAATFIGSGAVPATIQYATLSAAQLLALQQVNSPGLSVPLIKFLSAAISELSIYQAGETPSGEDLDLALLIFNELLDAWNADDHALYTTTLAVFTLTPNLQPHTLGLSSTVPAPTLPITTNRPFRLLSANLILNTQTPNLYRPLMLRDDDWWLGQRVPGLTSTLPTDCYYSPDFPNGSLYLWPVPTIAYGLQLEFMTLLAAVRLTDTLTVPPGYQAAMRLSLAEALVASFNVAVPPTLPGRAMEARARIFGNNNNIPRLMTATGALRSGNGRRSYFDFRTGLTS